ncbi:MAG: hypothetical protein ACM36C_11890 [Acidobacteriota bacterium]
MKSIVAALTLLFAAGSLVVASEPAVRDAAPAAVIAQFSQALPPEPPVVGELNGHQHMAGGASCCRMTMRMDKTTGSKQRAAAPCACCQHPAPGSHATK